MTRHQLPTIQSRLVLTAALWVCAAHPVRAQFTDAISREVSLYNAIADAPAIDAVSREVSLLNDLDLLGTPTDSISREVSMLNDLSPAPAELTDAISREVSVISLVGATYISSSSAAHALPVAGTLRQQLQALSIAPPAFNINTWLPVARRDANTRDAFCSTNEPAPLSRQYVDATMYLSGADEVTYDNTGSAYYRWTFTLPCGVRRATLSGTVNADDQGVLWLNGQQISGTMTIPACDPTGDPCSPSSCYSLQDTTKDRADSLDRPVLTAPTPDPVSAFRRDLLFFGPASTNELVFAVAGNAAPLDPTGVEFAIVVTYRTQCPGDADDNRAVNFGDITTVLSNFGGPGPDGDSSYDCTVSFGDITAVLANFGSTCPQ
jgi:hypothetical protein